MIENIQPVTLRFQSYYPGYTKSYLLHSSYSDLDVVGKAIWVDSILQPVDTELDPLYLFVTGLVPNTTYSIEAAYYDAMVDSELRAARFGMNISTPYSVTTRNLPNLISYSITSDDVDIGIAQPVLLVNLGGSADFLEVQWSLAGQDTWTTVYLGGFATELAVPNLPVGTLDIRIRGIVNFPDGQTKETSDWFTYTDITLDYIYVPPNAPAAPTFTVAKLAEPAERYDVKVDWTWDKGTGANAREFVVWRINKALYTSNPIDNKWLGAEVVNAGTSSNIVITNHPFDTTQRYRVSAVAWGPSGENVVYSEEVDFTITESTLIDNDFTTQTGIEVNYSHIKGLLNDGGTWKQTFYVSAATGAVAIGLLDVNGEAPISFDPVNGNVNVKGSVISEEIISASFVLANLTGGVNPSLRTTNKSAYGDGSDGIWFGYTESDGIFRFDMGSSTKYIRWDGNNLSISGKVSIRKADGTDIGLEDLNKGNSYYSQGISSWSSWSNIAATQFFQSNFGRDQNGYDVLTQYRIQNPDIFETRMWDPTTSTWVSTTLYVHGNTIVDGTIRASKLVADSAIINELGAEVIYNKAAYDSGTPEANYVMKIDLVNGSIHIR